MALSASSNVTTITYVEFTASASAASEKISSRNPSLKWAQGAEHLVPKELLRAINMDDFPERLTDSAGGLGNMPELTLLLEDDEVIKKFSVSLVIIMS